jgi:hypothetical protein
MLISLVTSLFSFTKKGFSVHGNFPLGNWPFCLLERKLLIPGTSVPWTALLFTKNANYCDHRSHFASFRGFDHNFISPYVIIRGCSGNFDWTGLSRQKDSTKRLIYFKMLVYTKSHATVPSFLFTVITVIGVIIAILALLRLTGFLLALCISLKHVLHNSHGLIAPRLLVGLLGLRGLTCFCLKGLTIAVIATGVLGVVDLVGTAVDLATLAKFLTATLHRDSTSRAPRRLALWITLGFRPGCSSLTLCLELLVLLLSHDALNSF